MSKVKNNPIRYKSKESILPINIKIAATQKNSNTLPNYLNTLKSCAKLFSQPIIHIDSFLKRTVNIHRPIHFLLENPFGRTLKNSLHA